MNRKFGISLSVLALSIGAAGCSSSLLEANKIDYKSAKQVSTLEVPPDLTAPTRDDRYMVPDVAGRGVATYSAYTSDRTQQPEGTVTPGVLPELGGMRIERAGSQRWLVVPGAPEALWQDIKDFWIETGFIINYERPELGVMETDWAEDRAKIPDDIIRRTLGRVVDSLFSTSIRDKFRTRLESGREPGTVEIFVSHRGVEEVYSSSNQDSTVWQPRPADPELEVEMLRRLMVRFGAEEQRAAEIVAADPGPERARLITSGDGSVGLSVDETFDRAWRRVGLALDRIGFTVEDRDRAEGLYFVRYIDPDQDARTKEGGDGLFARMAFWRSRDPASVRGGEYRIRVVGAGDVSQVSVLTSDGASDNSETARKMLGLLQAQLR